MLLDFLTLSRFRLWRRALFSVAFTPIALSMSLYSFGGYAEISAGAIYLFGFGIAGVVIVISIFNIAVLAPHYLVKGKYAAYTVVLLLLVAGFILFKYIAEEMVLSYAGISRTTNGITLLASLSNLMGYTITIASTSVSVLLRLWMSDRVQIENLENKHLKNRIEEFKNRINPQHLYTTLDDIAANVKANPKKASETLFELSEQLRQQLYSSRQNPQNYGAC